MDNDQTARKPATFRVREATDSDVAQIRDTFQAVYGQDYCHPQYYDLNLLKKMVYADDTLLLVAEDTSDGRIVGTASVVLETGAHADLVGEFGRLVVHPSARNQGVGKLLMEERLARVQQRLQLAIVDCRVVHALAQKIALANGFAPVGFLPKKLLLARRESLAVLVRHFGDALRLRRNNPRVISEVFQLAELAMRNCGMDCDAIVDDSAAPYPHDGSFELDELSADGYTTLLHFQRGRVRHREIFGPLRLHYGLFKLWAQRSTYLLARDKGQIIGAIGFTLDSVEKAARLFEFISLNDRPLRFLLAALEQKCREDWGIEYLEVDVSAHAPRMQRTLLEAGYLPAVYVPALAFHEVERLDGIRMVRLLISPELGRIELTDECRAVADLVMRRFVIREVLPQISAARTKIALFGGLNEEQGAQLASRCSLGCFEAGERIFTAGHPADRTYLLLQGEVEIRMGDATRCVGGVGFGECLGEISLLTHTPHSATATAKSAVQAAVLNHQDISELVRMRPDIGVIIYRNLAQGLAKKLLRSS